MRAFALTFLLIASVILPGLPTVSAAEATLSDATGDVVLVTGAGTDAAAPGGVGATLDLTALAVDETDDAIAFVLSVASLEEPGDATAEYFVDFTWGRVPFTAYAGRYMYLQEESTFGFLGLREGADPSTSAWRLEGVAPLDVVLDASAKTVRLEIPKAYLLDEQERPPVKGAQLGGVSAHAQRRPLGFGIDLGGSQPLSLTDAMPDDAGAGVPYVFKLGDEATGHVLLRSYDRVRVSNGGATTFVFQAIVKNGAEYDDELRLTLEDMPAGWNGSVEERVLVPAKTEMTIPVLATVPFEHDHGGYTSFALKATSSRDQDVWATLRLGVLHTPIPQPAGHHSELCLHAARGSESPIRTFWPDTQISMNTLCEHEGEAADVPQQWDGQWVVPLSPGLKMGLDFEVDEIGTLVGSIIGRGTGDADVSAELWLTADGSSWDFESGLLLASSDVQAIALDLQEATPFSLTLTPTPEADYIPYMQGQNMILVLRLEPEGMRPCCTAQTMPALVTNDFLMTLPLNEYHDRIETARGMLASPLALTAEGELAKVARPGTTATYGFTLKNDADREVTVEVDVAGTHAAAGALAPSGLLTLAPGESRSLTLGVRVPAESAADELIEVLVFAHAVDDPSLAALSRTVTRVGLGSDAGPDESGVFAAAQESENDTPAPGALLVLAALGAAALVASRRRR